MKTERYFRLIVDGKRVHDSDYWRPIRDLADQYSHRKVCIETVQSDGDIVLARLHLGCS